MTGFGVLGYGMRRAGPPLAPVILGVVLGRPLYGAEPPAGPARCRGGTGGPLSRPPITLASGGAVLGPSAGARRCPRGG